MEAVHQDMALNILTIDVSSGLHSPAVVKQRASACENGGFFQIVRHQVDVALRREFRSGRAAGDYADQGEEIQISWFLN